VSIYSCGPTVYDLAHIGNFRSYVFTDVLRRSLKLAGYKVDHAMNITDVDDKTIQKTVDKFSEPTIENLRDLTNEYIDVFHEDSSDLGLEEVEHSPRATDFIDPMVDLTRTLIEKKFAYKLEDSVYFSISKFREYGKLSGVDLSEVKHGVRYNADEYTKEDVRDFVLWKNEKEGEKIAWNTELGRGRPGWHLECSAMIHEIFKGPIDIHTGGVDLLFPHHENEIAQSVNAYGGHFVSFWLHCEHLLVDGRKMSKSEGNFYTIRDLINKGFHAKTIRYFLLSSHYRQKLNFTIEALQQTRQTIRRIWNFYNRLKKAQVTESETALDKELSTLAESWKADFLSYLEDDLNTARALSVMHEAIRRTNLVLDSQKDKLHKLTHEKVIEAFEYMDRVINILSNSSELEKMSGDDIPENLLQLLEKRNEARKNKDYSLSDELRDEIMNLGYVILDTPEGSRLQKKEI